MVFRVQQILIVVLAVNVQKKRTDLFHGGDQHRVAVDGRGGAARFGIFPKQSQGLPDRDLLPAEHLFQTGSHVEFGFH